MSDLIQCIVSISAIAFDGEYFYTSKYAPSTTLIRVLPAQYT